MVTDTKGQQWCMVLVERQNGTAFLAMVPGSEDIAVLGVFAWVLYPNAARIDYRDNATGIVHVLVNPVTQVEQAF